MQEIYSTPGFEAKYTYSGTDLGSIWSREAVFFRLWAPTANAVTIRLYSGGTPDCDDLLRVVPMTPDVQGTWTAMLPGDWSGVYYTYQVAVDGKTVEVCDPYARTTGVNGHRAMILNLSGTNPPDWEKDTDPHAGLSITDAVIYELHIRDLSMDPDSGITHKGKFLGLTETGTSLPCGISTGLDHILSLGVTHVQLLPVYDFGSVDESRSDQAQYNWGYDPVNFNVPEGSYSTDPYHGEVRVSQLKQMIKTLHDHGLSVIMDVVYNHVYSSKDFCFNRIVPGYFSRPGSNGSGCGNDTASERAMVRKYIVDSVCYWVEEYHMDGFRFDLAGLIDIDTIREAMDAVHRRNPHVLFYGEGWNMESLITKPNTLLANQRSSALIPDFAFFNDSIRDLLRGSVFNSKELGFATGETGNTDALRSCFMGVTPWACTPAQSINYVSCHDNHTLFDRLSLALPKASREELIRRCHLAAAFSILSQGVPFFLAGEEMLRSKPLGKGKYESNSYRSPDRINSLKWSDLQKKEYLHSFEYYRGLIAFRKAHGCLRHTGREEVLANIKPIPCEDPHTLAFRIRSDSERILLIFHTGSFETRFSLPDGSWRLCVDQQHSGTETLQVLAGSITVPAISTLVLVQPKPTQVRDVVAALIWRDDRFLICQRPAHKARGLLWEFVGGKTEPGESKAQALIRECQEELDITVDVRNEFMEVLHEYPDIHIRLTLFNCTIPQGEPKALEHNDLRWIHPREIPEYVFCPADKDILNKIIDLVL